MFEHSFGGNWTEDKLSRLKGYLTQYRRIFTSGKASYFTSWYVDAFAGSGSRSSPQELAGKSWIDDSEDDPDSNRYRDGSAKIALSLQSPFDHYLFIEKRKVRCEELRCLIDNEFPQLHERCHILQDDANRALCSWVAQRDWQKDRAVVFLDPYGLQVEWNTVQALGSTRGVDLWYLFPLSVIRLLKTDGDIDLKWRARLTSLFGTPDWEQHFYPQETKIDLFGETEVIRRDASVERVQAFIDERLRSSFVETARAHVLKNSNQSPLYSLCFAAANEKGAPIAIKIANSILSKD